MRTETSAKAFWTYTSSYLGVCAMTHLLASYADVIWHTAWPWSFWGVDFVTYHPKLCWRIDFPLPENVVSMKTVEASSSANTGGSFDAQLFWYKGTPMESPAGPTASVRPFISRSFGLLQVPKILRGQG